MPPTIQTGSAAVDRKRPHPGERRSELVCRVKYCNTLPDIPFDPKFITYPFESHRFVQYKPTSLERNYRHDLLTEHDLGVTIDLINPDTYAIDPKIQLHPEDEKLLEEEALAPQDSKRSRHHNMIVPWLKKTEYIATEFSRYGQMGEKTETKVGYNVKKLFKEEDLYMDRESQIAAIDKTFGEAQKPIEKHYSKPGVVPLDIMPVFPDNDLWKYPFAQVMFDADPAPITEMEEMSQAMIRGVMDESGEQFVAYFLPLEETMLKRKRDVINGTDYMDDDEYEYRMAREYNWNVKNKASKGYEENYFFVFRDRDVYYNELETRVRLSKRRLKPGMQPNNSKLVVRHRTLNEAELRTQEVRLLQLEPPQEEEEEVQEETQERAEKSESEKEEQEEDEVEQNEVQDGDQEKEDIRDESEASREGSPAEEEEEQQQQQQQQQQEEEEEDEEEEEEEGGHKEEEAKAEESEAESNVEQEEQLSEKSGSSPAPSSSESENEEEQKRRDEEEIFGSGSDSD